MMFKRKYLRKIVHREPIEKPKMTNAFGYMWSNRKHHREKVVLECGHVYTQRIRRDKPQKAVVCEKCAEADGYDGW